MNDAGYAVEVLEHMIDNLYNSVPMPKLDLVRLTIGVKELRDMIERKEDDRK